jgi:hypothetical protein
MIHWASILVGPLAAALFLLTFFLLRDVNWQAWADLLRRAAKYVRVEWQQMPSYERQAYAMRAGIVVFFGWWYIAIVKGW